MHGNILYECTHRNKEMDDEHEHEHEYEYVLVETHTRCSKF